MGRSGRGRGVAIGDYRTPFTILRQSKRRGEDYGDLAESFPAGDRVWGELSEPGASKRRAFNMVESRADAVIILRGYVTMTSNDRLRDDSTRAVYRVEATRFGRGDGGEPQTICEAYRRTEGEGR